MGQRDDQHTKTIWPTNGWSVAEEFVFVMILMILFDWIQLVIDLIGANEGNLLIDV